MILAKASLNCDCSFIVLATVITIVNYNHKTFIAQTTGDMEAQKPGALTKTPRTFFAIFLSPGANDKGWTQTLDLRMMRQVFYHWATNAGQNTEPEGASKLKKLFEFDVKKL
jgi:hypothetical protein